MPSAGIDAKFIKELGWDLNQAQVLFRLSVADKRSAWAHEVAKGFTGWLMTTPQFLTEQDELVRLHRKSIAKWGMPSLGRAVMRVTERAKKASVPRGLRAFCNSCEAFLLRWRLSELAAPDLPVPLQPMTPVPAPIFAMGPMNTVGGIFYFPDTFPIPSRDVLRGVLDDALRNHPPEHLASWTALIARGNSAKNQIARFGRLFEIQHYCRILQERHRIALHRNLGKLEGALADYFGVSAKAIRADFQFLRKRLGPDWMERPTPKT